MLYDELLRDVRVASPCSADWSRMQGNQKIRFCAGCKKNVYNLSAMTAPEAARTIQAREGKVCVRFYRRRDGTILTSDCPVGRRRIWSRTLFFASLIAGVVTVAIHSAVPRHMRLVDSIVRWVLRVSEPPPITEQPREPAVMGEPAIRCK